MEQNLRALVQISLDLGLNLTGGFESISICVEFGMRGKWNGMCGKWNDWK